MTGAENFSVKREQQQSPHDNSTIVSSVAVTFSQSNVDKQSFLGKFQDWVCDSRTSVKIVDSIVKRREVCVQFVGVKEVREVRKVSED